MISLALAVLNSWLMINMNTFKKNTFCRNICVATKFESFIEKKVHTITQALPVQRSFKHRGEAELRTTCETKEKSF